MLIVETIVRANWLRPSGIEPNNWPQQLSLQLDCVDLAFGRSYI